MADQRIENLARILVDYSLEIRKGDLFTISGETVAQPLMLEVLRFAARRGAHPVLRVGLPGSRRIVMTEMPEDELDFVSPIRAFEIEKIDATLSIGGESNTHELAGVDPKRLARMSKANIGIQQRFMQRAAANEVRWCYTLFSTYSGAQDAHMSLEEYENFVYHAMLLDEPDPVQAWRDMHARQEKYLRFLSEHDVIRVVAEDTDISVRTKGRTWINCAGQKNFPDGEVFTGPLEDSANGYIRYSYPTNYAGRESEDVRLWFENGVVTKWEALRGKDLLDELFAMDEGARRLGEFAIATNYGIPTFTRNILFDEKIGGTCHLAVGASIPESGGVNVSSLHWDMVCDLRKGGRIEADGEVFHENGQWLI